MLFWCASIQNSNGTYIFFSFFFFCILWLYNIHSTWLMTLRIRGSSNHLIHFQTICYSILLPFKTIVTVCLLSLRVFPLPPFRVTTLHPFTYWYRHVRQYEWSSMVFDSSMWGFLLIRCALPYFSILNTLAVPNVARMIKGNGFPNTHTHRWITCCLEWKWYVIQQQWVNGFFCAAFCFTIIYVCMNLCLCVCVWIVSYLEGID